MSKVTKALQDKLFINGEFVDSADGSTLDIVNPHDGSVITKVAEAREADVDKAVVAAGKAFPGWSNMWASERARLLQNLVGKLEENFDELAELEALDTGHPIRDTRNLDLPRTILNFRYFAGIADKIDGRQVPVEPGLLNVVKRVPVGVVGQIVPWNFPIMFCSWKLGPALAAGNTIVMKPSELVPLSTLRLAELINEAGIPKGVVNIVPGYGHIAGQHLAEHPGVQKIAFTGSTATGRKIIEASSGNLKRVSLELGGKGPNIVFDDADIDQAVMGSAFAIFHNQGQACIAGSRLLLHESIADEFIEKFVKLAKGINIGNPLDTKTEMGPLTSKVHLDRVMSHIDKFRKEEGQVLYGGQRVEEPSLANGFYLEPTIVEATPEHTVFKEEVFGPFVSMTRFSNDEQAIALANDSVYGLGSGLWTNSMQRAHQLAEKINAGMVWVNTYKRVHPGSPFGGVGESGFGRDMGIESLQEYTEAKSIWFNYAGQVQEFYKR